MRTVRNKARWGWLAGGAVALYGAVRAINRSLVEVQGPSMQPALWEGDRLLTVPARRGWLEPGQVVVVADPQDPDHLVVKRLTTIGAGRVEVHGDHAVASTDSRTWGPLPLRAVRRIAVARWPDLRSPLRRPA
jgi:nickel-type superoxide dismutase maturation protease